MEANKETIALYYGLCTCDPMYTKRNMVAPDCPWHSRDVDEAMEAYADQKLHLLQQENEALKRWKEEAKPLLNQIFDYAQDHPDMPLGGSMIEFVLNRCKVYDAALRDYNDSPLTFAALQQEYDKLKGENEDLKRNYTLQQDAHKIYKESYDNLLAEHAALASYNSNTNNQNENNGDAG